ncbi:hypothetical protein JCM11491_006727 [Sporobolomyces phaffii]
MASSKSLLRPLSRAVYYLPSTPVAATEQRRGTLRDAHADDPSLIIAFGWMDAQLKHVEKYLASYHSLFPTSPILLLQSSQKGFYSTANMHHTKREFRPAVDIIRQTQLGTRRSGSDSGGILVHVFSNGGCMSLKWLNQELAREDHDETPADSDVEPAASEKTRLLASSSSSSSPPSPPLAGTRAIVFDSCPGRSSLLVTMRAFSAPIRSKWLKLPAMGLLALLHGFISLYNLVSRKRPILDRLYSYLNDPSTLPTVPRLYLYSKVDELIPYRDVERHAAAAAARSVPVPVRTERFDATSHVGHVRGDPERYWRAIEETWRDSRGIASHDAVK